MKIVKASLCAAVAMGAMAFASAAAAEVSFNVGAATSYTFRGVKQTTGDCCGESSPQVFGGVDWTGGPNLYVGAWASNVGEEGDTAVEIDVYGGWKPTVGPVALDLGAIYYTYTDSQYGGVTDDWNTLEFKLAASVAAGPATVGAAVYYTDDLASSDESAVYYELNGSIPVRENVVVSAAIGQVDSDAYGATDSYNTWNIGLTVPVTEKFSIDARYIGTDNDAEDIFGSYAAGDQLVATVKAVF